MDPYEIKRQWRSGEISIDQARELLKVEYEIKEAAMKTHDMHEIRGIAAEMVGQHNLTFDGARKLDTWLKTGDLPEKDS